MDERLFSARRRPDRIHCRIVRCQRCSLVYSNPILEDETIAQLYHASHFTYDDLLDDLRSTYGTYLRRATVFTPARERFLEVGCGNGFLLEEATALGYQWVHGIEPSADAIAKARPEWRSQIQPGVLREGLFPTGTCDLIACFQTLDHVASPNEFLQIVWDLLKPGGIVLVLNHDVSAWSVRLLGECSPIFDIDHPYLYDRRTIRMLFEQNNFVVLEVGSAANRYPLGYWLTMAPLSEALRSLIGRVLSVMKLTQRRLTLAAGNLYLIGRKPWLRAEVR